VAEGLFGLGERFRTGVVGGETDRAVRFVVDEDRGPVVAVDAVFGGPRMGFEPLGGDIRERDDLLVPDRPQTEGVGEVLLEPGQTGPVRQLGTDDDLPVVGRRVDLGEVAEVDAEPLDADFEGVVEPLVQRPIGLHHLVKPRIRRLPIEFPPALTHEC